MTSTTSADWHLGGRDWIGASIHVQARESLLQGALHMDKSALHGSAGAVANVDLVAGTECLKLGLLRCRVCCLQGNSR